MSAIFGSKPDTSAQEKQLELQQKQLEAQEKRQEEASAREGAALQAKYRARQMAGRRILLADREDAELGIGTDITS